MDTTNARAFLAVVHGAFAASKLLADTENIRLMALVVGQNVPLRRTENVGSTYDMNIVRSSWGEGVSLAYIMTIQGQCMTEARKM